MKESGELILRKKKKRIEIIDNMCVLERNTRSITVRMSQRRWNRFVELEQAYRVANAVVRAKRECEKAPSMSVEDAMQFIREL